MQNTINQDSYEALEFLISKSRDASIEAKKVILWLLRQSENLTKPVCISIDYDVGKFSGSLAEQVAEAGHYMKRTDRSTYLDFIFSAMGSELRLNCQEGKFVNNRFSKNALSATLWVAPVKSVGYYGKAELLSFDLSLIEASKLRNWYSNDHGIPEFVEEAEVVA